MIRSTRHARLAGLATLMALLVAACGSTSTPSPTPPSGGPSTAPTGTPAPSAPAAVELLLRISNEGGFIGPAATLAAIPTVSVYSDGRIMTPGPIDAIYPGPLLPPVAVTDVGPAGAQAIVAAIRAAGLDRQFTGDPGVGNPDSGTTVFSVTVDGATITTRLHFGGGGPGLPGGLGGSPDPTRDAAQHLLERLQDPSETWGSTPVRSTLVPTAYRVFVAPGAPVGDGSTTEPSAEWPLATALDAFGVPAVPDRGIAGLRQGAVFGADALALGPVLRAATQLTGFSSGGKLYTLYVRPLLPDEVPAQG